MMRPVAATMLAIALCWFHRADAADFKVFYPNVVQGEFEFENRAFDTFDRDPSRANERNVTSELGYGITDWWFGELENEFEKGAQDKWRYHALGLENVFQLTEQGEHYLDVGFFAEYEIAMQRGSSDGFIFGPLLQKQFGRLLLTANLFVAADIGGHAPEDPQFNYAFEAKYLLMPAFQPGFQLFGAPGAFSGFSRYSQQDNRAGPVIFGEFYTAPGKIKYEAGYLVGLTHDSPSGTLKFLLEYEIAF
ncbi:MAG TPA: hypothetical protein VL899_14555 [Alphaproteobacteria bacterium]|jgi:hypothetical protein|nr:hypothetical protein [Alphaproteobacteria bacterium]